MKIKASFTVEASMLMPIIMVIIMSLISYNFYLHNYSIERSKMLMLEIMNEESEKQLDVKQFIRQKRY
ncbi:pilus assembly protein [Anaerosacchariphilus polymeriproducens]|uniref:Pilus assembly protein n=1 Tax=Anaerosacchariphilus polymeriproducens TaxID=1812858 RepID=A0A371AZP4_9FIRM|nr:pilus assembly protein [Anaerosacchariphilus polymeriproducens]